MFEPNYKLKSLDEVEQFIKRNKHLPCIPSAKEIEENQGFDIGATQIKLLEKVEEMMLYIIELKRENEALKSEIFKLK